MKDVAREAGVSLGTVSKVMNGIPVGEPYRVKVEAAASKLGYRVNTLARALRTSRTGVIAILLPSIKHPFFGMLADELTGVLTKKGYRAQLMITNYDNDSVSGHIAALRDNKVDGIIGLTYRPDLMLDDSIPFVSIDRFAGANVPCVSSDNYGGGQMAAEKLLSFGCKSLLFLRIGSFVSGEPDKRAAGFESICRAKGIRYDMMILDNRETEERFDDYLRKHFQDGKKAFDGIFCNTDQLALRTVVRLRNLGVKVPEDVQVIGFDGIPDFVTGKYLCSTIVQPVAEMAETAVSILLEKDSRRRPALVNLPVSYAAGGTTRE